MGSEVPDPVETAYAARRAILEQLETDPRDALAGLMLGPNDGLGPSDGFLKWLCRYLQETLDVDAVLVGQVSGRHNEDVNTLHVRGRGGDLAGFSYQLTGPEGFHVLDRDQYQCCARASEVVPSLQSKIGGELESYIQITVRDIDGLPLGLAAVIAHRPLSEAEARSANAHLEIFRARLAAELIRRRAIRTLQLASSSALTSQATLEHLVLSLSQATQVRTAFVAEREVFAPPPGSASECVLLTTMAGSEDGVPLENTTMDVTGTILAEVYPPEGLLVADKLKERCPRTAAMTPFEGRSFVGYQVYGAEGEMLAQVVLLHDRVLPASMLSGPLLRLLLTRISGELQRLDYEKRNAVLQRRLMDSEHRESIGSLASGIAHDFNNILFAVSGQAHLVDRMYRDDESLREQMSVIIAACEQASGLCQQLMIYSGTQPSDNVDLDLNSVIVGCQRIAGIFAKGKGKLAYRLSDTPLMINGSLARLQQVVMNLLKNAADAIEPGGNIRVITRAEECSQRDFDGALLGEAQKGGSYAVLEVIDDGPGIPQSLLRQIFTPFFSTKESGHGMGLTAVLGGAKEHGAAIFVKTPAGGGSCFQIYFPTTQNVTTYAPSEQLMPAPAAGVGSRILVIDDDDLVRQTVARILVSEGFDVTCAASGKEGLAAAQNMAGSLAAVVLDYFMPQMLGDEVLVHLNKVVPGVPVLLISGNVSSAQVEAFEQPPRAFLSKPVLPQMLADTVRSMIQV